MSPSTPFGSVIPKTQERLYASRHHGSIETLCHTQCRERRGALAEVDGNRTRRTGIARPNRFEGGGAHQVPGHLHDDKAPLTLSASTRVHGSGTVAGWVRGARSILSPHRLPHVSALRLRALGAWSWSHSAGLPKVAAEPRSSRPLSRSASGATRCSSTSTVIFLRYSGLPRVIARASTTGCVQRHLPIISANSSSTSTRP